MRLNSPSNQAAVRIYSILFVLAFFIVSLLQLNAPNLSLKTVPENFLWRQGLMEKFNNFRFVMGDKVFPGVIIGRDDWLFFTGEKSIEDYQKSLRLNPKDMRDAMKGLALFNKIVAENGGRLIVVIAPDKHT